MELEDDDLVLVEDPVGSAPAPSSSRSFSRSASPVGPELVASSAVVDSVAIVSRPRAPMPSRRIFDEAVEQDVAGQCLASLAAETRERYSSSHLRASLARPLDPFAPLARGPRAPHAPLALPPPRSPAVLPPPGALPARLPSVSAPPLARGATARGSQRALPEGGEGGGVLDLTPASAFVRRSSPTLPPSSSAVLASSVPALASTSALAGDRRERSVGSVAPTSLSQRAGEATVILVRERPKAAWVLASAVIGAACALGAVRLLEFGATEREDRGAISTTTAARAVVVAPPPAEVLPAPAEPGPAPSAAVVRFAEDEGVAIQVPLAPSAAPSAAPHAVAPRPTSAPVGASMGPALPDGSFSLGRSASAPASTFASRTAASSAPTGPVRLTPASSSHAPVAPGAAAAESGRHRPLSPEQQLAEAQLKASMR